MKTEGARVLGPSDGRAGQLGSMGVRFMLASDETGGGFSLVEHPIPPRALNPRVSPDLEMIALRCLQKQ